MLKKCVLLNSYEFSTSYKCKFVSLEKTCICSKFQPELAMRRIVAAERWITLDFVNNRRCQDIQQACIRHLCATNELGVQTRSPPAIPKFTFYSCFRPVQNEVIFSWKSTSNMNSLVSRAKSCVR